MGTLLGVLIALCAPEAQAQQITVTIDSAVAEEAGVDVQEVEDAINGAIDGQLHFDDLSGYMTEMANAAVLSTKGMGIDYATNPQRFVVGGSVGTAVSGAGIQLGRGAETVPEAGFAFQLSGVAGVNLGVMSSDESFLRRFMIYVNGMALNTQLDPFTGSLLNLGAHAQMQILRPGGRKGIFEWGGLAASTGFEYASYQLVLSQPLPVESDYLTWDAVGTYDVHATAASIPVELSSNLRISVATVYFGGALDINQGSDAETSVQLKGDLITNVTGEDVTLGTVGAKASLGGVGTAFFPRAFAGVQVNIYPVKIYVHANAATDLDLSRLSFGANAGLRFAL